MRLIRGTLAAIAGAAMLVSTSLATASPARASSANVGASNPWVTLSMMNPAGAAALGDAAAVAQTSEYQEQSSGIPLAIWGFWLAVIAFDLYLILNDDDGDDDVDEPEPITPD